MPRAGSALRLTAAGLAALLLLIIGLRACRFEHRHAYDAMIREAAARHGIDPAIIKAVIKQESRFRPWQVGAAGEVGLMQLTSGAVTDWETATGQRCRYRGLLFDPRLNIEIGTWYLARALRRWRKFDEGEMLALAEYNAGLSRAREWAPEANDGNVLPRIRFPSTRKYISNVLRYRERYRDGETGKVGQ